MFALLAVGMGPVAFRPAAAVWGNQAAGHEHAAGAGAPQAPAPQAGSQMPRMRQDMMARMTAADNQLKTLVAEMNSATTTDAKVAAMTKVINLLIEQRSMMRMQMDMQGSMMEGMMSPKAPR